MAMVRQLTEGEIINGGTPDDDSMSEHLENFNNIRPPSRSSSGSKRSSPAVMPSLQYSKDELIKFSTLPLSQSRPACLDPAYNNSTGKWDPERWFMNHRSDRILPLEEPRVKRERQDDMLGHKRKSSDPKERIKEEKDDIVLSPQRRSFGTGCHVIPQSSLARRPGSPTDGRDSESFRDSSRRIGSGRIMRDQRDWERDREYGYGNNRNERRDRFDQDDNEKDMRRYSNRYNRNDRRSRSGRDRIDEIEPEWFSSGPTSQSETIELVGFEDPHNDDENKKPSKKSKRKQNSRRSSLKSEEGEKQDTSTTPPEDNSSTKKAEEELKKPIEEVNEEKVVDEEPKDNKPLTAGFEIDDLFKIDWMPPGFIPSTSPPPNENNEMGCSRFSQWFRKESPVNELTESGNNSCRSSLQEELIANVLNSIVEPQLSIPSPTENSSDNFFTPISPAQSHSTGYTMSQTMQSNTNKDIMDIFQTMKSNNETPTLANMKESGKTVQELEADLKKLVLGDQKQEEKSAFDKLLQHMSDSRSSPTASLSIGPLDKSKAVQEQDLLQDMLRTNQPTSNISPVQQVFQMFEEKQPMFKLSPGMSSTQFSQAPREPTNDIFAHLLQQKQHEQHMQQIHQQQQLHQLQNHMQQQNPGLTVDMITKLLGSTPQAVSPSSSSLQSSSTLNRNDPQMINSVVQYQRQRELLSSILKQQQQQHPLHNLPQSSVLQPMPQRRCPSAKDIPIQQTLALPTLGISPRQSPMPSEAIGSAIPSQGRIPSPLVFGQQPPALSHAPAPIHPAALAQAMVQNTASSNTLQVQNPVVLQRVPSPQELAVHTQSILQNALIKRKLEEQKENFRKRQEAQRASSPVTSAKNSMTPSPLKGLSPTIAFTPTSVMRKIQSEKVENKELKNGSQNGIESKISDNVQNFPKSNSVTMPNPGHQTSFESNLAALNNSHLTTSYTNASLNQVPRAVHGQGNNQPRSIHGALNSVNPLVIPNQGRPIVKVGMTQPLNPTNDLARSAMALNKPPVTHNKSFLSSNNQGLGIHDMDPSMDALNKFTWHQQMARQQNASAMPPLQMAATYAALNQRPPPLNPHHTGLLRPVNMASAANVPSSNVNFPLLRNSVQNPIRAQTNTLNQLNQLGQLAALQLQRGAIDNRQYQALAQSQRFHPAALQQMLLNSQNQVTAAQAHVAGFPGNRDSKHQHLLPGQASANRSSPVNLAKWFGNDVLKQKMPDMPPVSHQKALLVEEVERQQ